MVLRACDGVWWGWRFSIRILSLGVVAQVLHSKAGPTLYVGSDMGHRRTEFLSSHPILEYYPLIFTYHIQ